MPDQPSAAPFGEGVVEYLAGRHVPGKEDRRSTFDIVGLENPSAGAIIAAMIPRSLGCREFIECFHV